jgi:hypothetical protein
MQLIRVCNNQWTRVAGMSSERRTGIPFTDVKTAAQLIGLKLSPKRFRLFTKAVEIIVNEEIRELNDAASSR